MLNLQDECPLCDRPLATSWDDHHLIPKTFKGTGKVRIHKMCHRKIHSVFTERELKNYYHTIDRLKENDHIQKFVVWIKKKDPDFYDNTKDTQTRKRKRRR